MKIVMRDPKNYLGTTSSDTSRLGRQASAAILEDLPKKSHGIVIFGLADDQGVKNVGGRPGAALGPEAARSKLYKFTSGPFPFPLYDLGDLVPHGEDIAATHGAAAEAVRRIHDAGHLPLCIGGGHDMAFAEALALLESFPGRPLSLLNVDAHLDLRPAEPKITSGSPWYLLQEQPEFLSRKGRIVEFGIQPHCNSLDLVEYAKRKKIKIHWLSEIRSSRAGAEKLFRKTLSDLTKKHLLQVSIDIDSACSSEAPGCSAPQTVGFSAEELIRFSEAAGTHPKVQSFGVYELSPPLDHDNRTAALVAHCVLGFLRGASSRFPRKLKRHS